MIAVVRRIARNVATSANTNHEIAVWGSLFVAGEESRMRQRWCQSRRGENNKKAERCQWRGENEA